MANGKFRAAQLYIASNKIGEAQTSDLEITSNDESQIGADGYLGDTEGVITCKCSFKTIVPVGGHKYAIIKLLLNKQDVNIGFLVDGVLLQFTGRIKSGKYDSDSKTGAVHGDFSFEGGNISST